MALKKSEKRLLIILGVVIVIVVIFQFVTGDDGNKKNLPKPSTTRKNFNIPSIKTASSGNQSQEPLQDKKEKKYYDSWGENPFSASPQPKKKSRAVSQTTAAVKTGKSKHKFLGVFEALGKKYALIDDLVIAEGDSKEGIEILEIEGEKVVYRENGRIFSLHWSEKL